MASWVMLEALITILLAVLVGYILFWAMAHFISDPRVRSIIGIIIALIILLVALQRLGVGSYLR